MKQTTWTEDQVRATVTNALRDLERESKLLYLDRDLRVDAFVRGGRLVANEIASRLLRDLR